MAKIEQLVPFILKWEGGFSNDPADTGGATMRGITWKTFREYRSSRGQPAPTLADLKAMSMAEWTDILRTRYWDPWQADRIESQAVANLLVGWGWGSGVGTAVRQLQQLLKLDADGIVGPKTLGAINGPDEVELFRRIWLARKDFFVDIVKRNPSQIKFLSGWLNRLYDNVGYCFVLKGKV
jgi:lysozyme family protein